MYLTLGVIFGIIAMLAFGFIRIPQQRLIQRMGIYSALFYVYLVEVATLAAIFIPTWSEPLNYPYQTILLILLTGIIGTLAISSLFKALSHGHVSVMSTLAQMQVVVVLLLSIIFLHEKPTLVQIAGIGMTLVGALLVSFKEKDLVHLKIRHVLPGTNYAILTAALWGVFYILYKLVVRAIGPFPAAVFTEGTIFLTILGGLLTLKLKSPKRQEMKYILAAGIVLAIGAYAFNKGMSLAPVSVITALIAASPIVTAILANIFLKEALDHHQKIGILTAVLGIILISP